MFLFNFSNKPKLAVCKKGYFLKNDSIIKRLWKRWPARVSILAILLTFLIALFAYVISPDNTVNANDMAIELDARPAGFTKQFLLIPLQSKPEERPFLERIFLAPTLHHAR